MFPSGIHIYMIAVIFPIVLKTATTDRERRGEKKPCKQNKVSFHLCLELIVYLFIAFCSIGPISPLIQASQSNSLQLISVDIKLPLQMFMQFQVFNLKRVFVLAPYSFKTKFTNAAKTSCGSHYPQITSLQSFWKN